MVSKLRCANRRLKPPLMMVALGTFNDQTGKAGNMQGMNALVYSIRYTVE